MSSKGEKKKLNQKSRRKKIGEVSASKSTSFSLKNVPDETSVYGSVSSVTMLKPFVKGELVESLKHMMFGFGDGWKPLDDTAELMEELVVEYIHSMSKKAMEMSSFKGKLDTECFIFLMRKDPRKYERIKELLKANDDFRMVLNSSFDPVIEKMH